MTSAFQLTDRNEGKYYIFLYICVLYTRAVAPVHMRSGKREKKFHYLDLSALIHFIHGGGP